MQFERLISITPGAEIMNSLLTLDTIRFESTNESEQSTNELQRREDILKMNMETVIDNEGAIAIVIRNWLPSEYAQNFHERLTQQIPWIQGQMNTSERTIQIPRMMFFLGDDIIKSYSYSRLHFPVQSWNSLNSEKIEQSCTPCGKNNQALYEEVEDIRNRIRNDIILKRITGVELSYNSCLLNFYRNGNDKIDPHSDREALGPMNAVVTISLGGTRKFVFKNKIKEANGRYRKIETMLNNGDLMLMVGRCQELWTHSVPRENTQQSRISLTYRLIKEQIK
ncbi:Alpha-ketoglutarate-dependent repair dioxygenase AlkB [uncultured virus]|nr:Alpha-ketoglutarate-dependent repair dioxygenase AlkB [uncultured virus]